ncbi:chloride channel protein [Pokkaliibacter sp. CJK22405]|uniref:chloride channel protein n=1 Tax=Pokkaliibacter sp. CJK22405 TaxID=3384615 RepID=UPI003984C0F3
MLRDVFTLSHFRGRLAHVEALPQLALLGLLCGIATGLVMALFRWVIQLPLEQLLGDPEAFEKLTLWERGLFPLIGAVVIILIFLPFPASRRRVGIVYVLERLNFHQGYLHGRNALIQFFTGAIAVISGMPGGREGPAIHLGAAVSSLMGQRIKVPNNTMRLLIGCGSAAAISASFNTPLAGVLFAMEVVLMEYTVSGFLPVMIASVTAAVMNYLLFSSEVAFIVPELRYHSLSELPYIMLLGCVLGALAAAFCKIVTYCQRLHHWPMGVRLLCAGAAAALAGMLAPQVMGIGYDTISDILQPKFLLSTLLLITLVKLLATAICFGLGMPMGCIGPILFIGAAAGGSLGMIANLMSHEVGAIGFYAMLGMGSMMSAVLQAPLAALTALLELTHNSNIIFPGMLAIVVANLTCAYIFKQKSLFWCLLLAANKSRSHTPLALALSRESVAVLMRREVPRFPHKVTPDITHAMLDYKGPWYLLERESEPVCLLSSTDFRNFLVTDHAPITEDEPLNLLAIAAVRKDLKPVSIQATLKEAMDTLDQTGVEALYVTDWYGKIAGILTRDDLLNYMNSKQTIL